MVTAIILDDNLKFAKFLTEKIMLFSKQINFPIELKIAQTTAEILDVPVVYDIYFMDIQMPGASGINVVKLLREKGIESEVVFVSSYDMFMQQSIFVKPRAFVRKEKLEEDLLKSMEVIKSIFEKKNSYIYIQEGKKRYKIFPSQVMFCKTKEHYAEIHYINKEDLVIRIKLSELHTELNEFGFIRTHSRYIVNTLYVQTVKRQEVILSDGKKVPISRSYREQMAEYIMKSIERL